MLKKILNFSFISVIFLSTTTFAGEQTTERNGFYFKADIGASKMKNAKQVNQYRKGKINVDPNKSKSKTSLPISIAALIRPLQRSTSELMSAPFANPPAIHTTDK